MPTTEIVWSCFKCETQYASDPSPISRMLMDRMIAQHEAKCCPMLDYRACATCGHAAFAHCLGNCVAAGGPVCQPHPFVAEVKEET